nr:hypothetical protein [Tanacetum cinerariifolium]
MFKLDLDPLAHRLLKNKDAHIDYLKYTQEQADIPQGIVEQAKEKQPLDNALDFACKHAKRIHELLVYVRDTCPNANIPSEKLVVVTPMNKVKKVKFFEPLTSSSNIHKQNDRIKQTTSRNMKNKVEVQLRRANLTSNKKNRVKDPIYDANVKHTMLNANFELIYVKCKQCMFDANHDVCLLDFVNDVNVRSKSKSAKQSQQHNTWKPMGKVFTEVGYKWKPTRKLFTLVGNSCPLTRFTSTNIVPHKETTSHSVETQKSEIKVYSRRPKQVKYVGSSKQSKIIESRIANNSVPNPSWGSNATDVPYSSFLVNDRILDGVDLLSRSRDTNLYTISLDDMLKTYPICLISKASKTKTWLWHHTLNQLAKDGLTRGIPKLKFKKDHLCSACALGKSKKSSHQPKAEDTNQVKLYLMHMDLCGPIYIDSINGKKYILTLHEFYEDIGISHQTSVARTPQQNSVVERRNQTLVEVARTMLIFSKALLFLWAEAINTTCYTQNRSLIRLGYNKTPYELMHDKKLDLSFIYVFGSLCYPTNDNEDLDKLNAKANNDAPSTSIPSTQKQEQSLIISQDIKESLKTPHFHDDPLHETLHDDSTSQGSSLNVWPSHTSFKLLGKWTKNHPIANVIEDPSRPVSTRKQLQTDTMWCYFDAFLISVEPKNYKQAMLKPSSIDAMQEDVHEFEILKVWELVPCPDLVMLIKWKWIFKVKNDECGEDDSILGPMRFVSKADDYQVYRVLLHEVMTNQKIRDSPAYNTNLAYATGAASPKKARKFKKSASPSRKRTLVTVEEEEPEPAKKKAPTTTDKSKGIDLLSEAALHERLRTDSKNQETSDDEEESDYKFVHTHEDYVPTDHEMNDEIKDVDEEEYDRIDKELYGDVNVRLTDFEQDDEVTTASATTITSLLSSLFPYLQQSIPILTTTNTEATTLTITVPEFKTLSDIQQRITDLEKDVKELKSVDNSTIVILAIKSEALNTVKEYLELSPNDALYKRQRTSKGTETHKKTSTSKDSSKGKCSTTSSKSGTSAKDQVEKTIFVEDSDYAKLDDAEFDYADMPMDQGEYLVKTDEQLNDEVVSKNDWLNDLAKATKPPLTFDELIHTPIDFSAFAMNHLKIDNLIKEHLVGPVYNLLKGTCKSYMELDYTIEECYRALSEQLDWNNPEGHRCPYDLTKPLPVQMSSQGHQIVLVDFFFNNDLEYLRGGSNDKKYTAYTTKSKDERPAYTTLSNPQGVIYKDKLKRKRFIRADELHKFSDNTLILVRDTLDQMLHELHLGYNTTMGRRKWTRLDQQGPAS